MKELKGEPTQNCATCQYRKRKGSGSYKGVLIRDPDFGGKCCRPEGLCERRDMIDLEKMWLVCPKCGHDWIAHFQMVDTDGNLIDPTPRPCMECAAPGCTFAQDEKHRREGNNPGCDKCGVNDAVIEKDGEHLCKDCAEEDNFIIIDAVFPKKKKKPDGGPDPRQMDLFSATDLGIPF